MMDYSTGLIVLALMSSQVVWLVYEIWRVCREYDRDEAASRAAFKARLESMMQEGNDEN